MEAGEGFLSLSSYCRGNEREQKNKEFSLKYTLVVKFRHSHFSLSSSWMKVSVQTRKPIQSSLNEVMKTDIAVGNQISCKTFGQLQEVPPRDSAA